MLCREKDAYFEYVAYIIREAHYVIELSNGEKIYQDDYREGQTIDTWTRLKDYIYENNLKIVSVTLQNFDNIIKIPIDDKTKGVFFKKGLLARMFEKDNSKYYLVGTLDGDNNLRVKKYLVPELVLIGSEIRNPEEYKDRIIYNER